MIMRGQSKNNTAIISNSTGRTVETAVAGAHFTAYQQQNYPDLTYAAENAVQAVVNIEKREQVSTAYGSQGGSFDPFFEFFGIPQGTPQNQTPRERRSGGSGVIISPDGYIVTNNHVVENASKLKVKLNDQRTFEARIIGTDPTTDVALIKIDAEDLPSLAFGSSDDLRLGEWVLAIGSPFDLQSTITAGIVSSKARKLDVIPSQYRVESFIQTDAAVNPGNSGGALVNTAGELVGINTVIKSQTGSYIGYSFAVPSSIVKKVVVDLKEYGLVQRAMIGVQYQEINDDFIEQMGQKTGIADVGGVYVSEVVPDGAAEAAGIKVGDVLLEIDGEKIGERAPLSEIISRYRPNDKVKILAKRDGKVKQFDVVLRNKVGKAELLRKSDVEMASVLGGEFAEISDKERRELKINNGIKVVKVDEGGVMSRARIREGFIITHINENQVRKVSDLNRLTPPVLSIDGIYPNGRAISYSIVQ